MSTPKIIHQGTDLVWSPLAPNVQVHGARRRDRRHDLIHIVVDWIFVFVTASRLFVESSSCCPSGLFSLFFLCTMS